jgi:hypothetical protein
MAVKAKHRTKTTTKIVYVPAPAQNGNGFHKNDTWVPGDSVEDNPIARIAGSYKDDPFWGEFVQIMKDERQKELERDLKNLENEP